MSTDEQTPADAWGQPISAERQAELQGFLDRWAADKQHERQRGPFDWNGSEGTGITAPRLSGADVYWLTFQFRDEKESVSRLQLQGADLSYAQLQGANLYRARLTQARLIGASFDQKSRLNDAILTEVALDQVTFDNTNLSVVDWRLVPVLGDELTAQNGKDHEGKRKPPRQRVEEYQAAARAYRRLAVALQANGLSEEAAGSLYRAQIMQRRLAYRERRFGAYLFSVLLAVLAGYGYRLWRIVVSYLSVVTAFTLAYLAARYLAGTFIDWEQVGEAAQISLNAIHGRVFFAQLALDSTQAWIATVESVVGIVIEGVFVAMLIQRFFGK